MKHNILLGKRKLGEVYLLSAENKELHKARIIDGKRYAYHHTCLKQSCANGMADALRDGGHLARVIPRKVWINKAGYELGVDRVQGYVVYVHYK